MRDKVFNILTAVSILFADWLLLSIFVYVICYLLGLNFTFKLSTAIWIALIIIKQVMKRW